MSDFSKRSDAKHAEFHAECVKAAVGDKADAALEAVKDIVPEAVVEAPKPKVITIKPLPVGKKK